MYGLEFLLMFSVVEVIAPFGGACAPVVRAPISEDVNRQRQENEMVKDLIPAKEIHFLAVNKDGKQVRVL